MLQASLLCVSIKNCVDRTNIINPHTFAKCLFLPNYVLYKYVLYKYVFIRFYLYTSNILSKILSATMDDNIFGETCEIVSHNLIPVLLD